jgi:hypothetical protein
MFRKLLLASVATLGLLAPLALTTTADAHDYRPMPRHEYRQECEYRVFYRASCERGWTFGGEFHNRARAEHCAEQYRCHGYEVSIR